MKLVLLAISILHLSGYDDGGRAPKLDSLVRRENDNRAVGPRRLVGTRRF